MGASIWNPARPYQSADPYVDPVSLGAAGTGTANDSVYILEALNSGKIVDLGGRSFGVMGTIEPTGSLFRGIRNGELIQLAPTTSECKTLNIVGASNFFIENFKINRGGSAGYTVGTLGANADWAGLRLLSCSKFTIKNSFAYNGGRGTGIAIFSCTDWDWIGGGAYEMYWQEVNPSVPVIVDDVAQGFWINNCQRFGLTNVWVYNVTSGAPGNPATGVATAQISRYTRNAFGGNSEFEVLGCRAINCDQGFDFTGSTGNFQFNVTACTASELGSVGFKCANSSYSANFTNCIAEAAGDRGFLVQGKSELSNPDPRDIVFNSCLAINTGSNLIWPTTAGFAVESGAVAVTFPRAVKFVNCKVIDTQGTPTTDFGFRTNITPLARPTTGYNLPFTVTTVECEVNVPGMSQSSKFSGIHFPAAAIQGDGAGTVNVNTSNWTQTDFDGANIYDPSDIHNPGSSNSETTIKESGLYDLMAQAIFPASATGYRSVRVAIDGTATESILTPAHPTLETLATDSYTRFLPSGTVLTVQLWQNSGGTLVVNRANVRLIVSKKG